MPMNRLDVFANLLTQAAVPFWTVSGTQPYSAETVTIDFKAEATQEQRDWANAQKATFDWRTRRFVTDGQLAAVIAGLTNAQQNQLLRRLLARLIKQAGGEEWILQLAAELGVSVPYDEVVP